MTTWYGVTQNSNIHIRVGSNGEIETNTDPNAYNNVWVQQNSGVGHTLREIVWTGFRFVVVGDNGTILYSEDDGVTWTSAISGTNENLYDVVSVGMLVLAVGGNGTFLQSNNGIDWNSNSTGTTKDLYGIDVTNSNYTIVGEDNIILTGQVTSTLLDVTLIEIFTVEIGGGVDSIFSDIVTDGLDLTEASVRQAAGSVTPYEQFIHEYINTSNNIEQEVGGDNQIGTDDSIPASAGTAEETVIENTWISGAKGFEIRDSGSGLPFFININDYFVTYTLGTNENADYKPTVNEAFTIDKRLFDNPINLDESFTVSVSLEVLKQYVRVLAEVLEMDDSITSDSAIIVRELIGIQHSIFSNGTFAHSVQDTITLNDVFLFTTEALLTEDIQLSDSLSRKLLIAKVIAEQLVASGLVKDNHIANRILSASLYFNDILERYFDGTIAENFTIDTSALNELKLYEKALEDITLSSTLQNYVVISCLAGDDIEFSGTTDIAQILKETIEDGFSFLITFAEGDDVYTGWVMNVDNYAVTNYQNYNFNSLTHFNDMYLGANTSGIYKLEGTTDEGSYIESRIATAKLDFNSSNLKHVNGAYLGIDIDGDIIFKLITDDDFEVYYRLENTDGIGLHQDYIKFGKGIKGRYWQFELIAVDTEELRLDTLELYPMLLQRKR